MVVGAKALLGGTRAVVTDNLVVFVCSLAQMEYQHMLRAWHQAHNSAFLSFAKS